VHDGLCGVRVFSCTCADQRRAAAISGYREKGGKHATPDFTHRTDPRGHRRFARLGRRRALGGQGSAVARPAGARGVRPGQTSPDPALRAAAKGAEAALGAAAGESTLKAVVQEALGSQPVPDQRGGAQTGAVPMGPVPMDAVPTGAVPMDAVQMELAEGAPARILLERSVGAEMLVLGSTRPGPGPAGRAGAASAAPAVQSRPPLGPVARGLSARGGLPGRGRPPQRGPGSGRVRARLAWALAGSLTIAGRVSRGLGFSGAGPVPQRRNRAPFGVPGPHPVAIQRPVGQRPGPEHHERGGEHGHGDHEEYATGQLTLAQRGGQRAVVGQSDVLRPTSQPRTRRPVPR